MTLISDSPTRTGSMPAPGSGPGAGAAGPGAPAVTQPGAAGAPGAPMPPECPCGRGDDACRCSAIGGPRSGRPSVLRFTDSMGRALDQLAEDRMWSMSDEEVGEALVDLTRQAARLEELRGRVLLEADARNVGHAQGASSTAAWLAHRTKQTVPSVFADLRLAQKLEEEFPLTRAAMAGRLTAATPTDGEVPGPPAPGIVDAEKARILIRAVRDLTTDHGDLVTAGVRERAEAHLVDLAARFDSVTLKKLAKRLVEVVCPEAADAAEGDRLDREEQAARRKAYLQVRDNGDGTSTGSFKIPTLHADLLRTALDGLTSPRQLGEGRLDPETGKPLSTSTLRGHGFMTLLEHHLDLDTLPGSAGSAFTVVVHVNLDTLRTGLGVASVETGHRVSAAEARRLACQAGIIPVVLGGDSMPLDLGRERRLFSKHQRIAMDHTYGGCAAESCDLPPSRVEYHHTDPWHRGGKTDLKDGLPLCPPHHHMADHPDLWDMRRLPTGGIRFARRQ